MNPIMVKVLRGPGEVRREVLDMATLAIPFRELERSVFVNAEKARSQAERVVRYSVSVHADLATTCKVALGVVCLKWLLGGLVRHQSKLISEYQDFDFNHCTDNQLIELATSLEEIIRNERAMLTKANSLGSEVRVWWGESLLRLSEQVDHLESIADSLRVASSDEASTLLAMAVEQFVA
jgi:hypothetical protein